MNFGKSLTVFLIYLVLAVFYTYPLVLKLDRSVYGYPGDNFGAIHFFWWWKYTSINRLDFHNSFLEQSPFGYRIDSDSGAIFYYWPLKTLTWVFDEVVSYNLVNLVSFPLAALAMFLLANFLVSHSLISFWAGFVFSFSPYHFWKSYNHLDLTLLWPIPLSVLFLLKILKDAEQKKRSGRNIFLASFFTAATILSNFYYGFFLLLAIFLFSFFYLVLMKVNLRYWATSLFLKTLITLLLVSPFIFPVVFDAYVKKGQGQSAARVANYNRPLLDLVALSARPWDYLIPSSDNPILGGYSAPIYEWISTRGKDFKVVSGPVHERTIFLGFVTLSLLLLSFSLYLSSRDFKKKFGRLNLVLWLTLAALFLISMPPYFFLRGKYTFYLPSFWLYQIIPVFRTYSRLGIFVLLFAVLAAVLVLKFLSQRLKKVTFWLSLMVLTLFSVLEFANVPPAKVTDLKMPEAFAYLGQKPEGLTFVVYPKEFNVADLLIFQPQFRQGFLNFHSQSEYWGLWPYLENFRDDKTPRFLSSLGIDYAVFQKELIFKEANPVDDLWYRRALRTDVGQLPEGFILDKDFGQSLVYRIEAEPLGLVVLTKDKIETFPKRQFTVESGVLKIYFANLKGGSELLSLELKDVAGQVVAVKDIVSENVKRGLDDGWLNIELSGRSGWLELKLPGKDLTLNPIWVQRL